MPIPYLMAHRRSTFGCLFWIALILLVLVIILFNRQTIEKVLKSTDFLTLFQKEKEIEKEPEVVRKTLEDTTPEEEKEPGPVEPGDNTIIIDVTTPEEEVQKEIEQEPEKLEENRKLRQSRVYFVDVHGEGTIVLKSLIRTVSYVNSPLTETINVLLKGLTPAELNKELLSLIPEGTKLLSAVVKDGTAYLNFNEPFRFNSFGIEGYNAQLRQVIFTATEFPTVKNVQFLIEGEIHNYLGPEGVYIGEPLGRNSF